MSSTTGPRHWNRYVISETNTSEGGPFHFTCGYILVPYGQCWEPAKRQIQSVRDKWRQTVRNGVLVSLKGNQAHQRWRSWIFLTRACIITYCYLWLVGRTARILKYRRTFWPMSQNTMWIYSLLIRDIFLIKKQHFSFTKRDVRGMRCFWLKKKKCLGNFTCLNVQGGINNSRGNENLTSKGRPPFCVTEYKSMELGVVPKWREATSSEHWPRLSDLILMRHGS